MPSSSAMRHTVVLAPMAGGPTTPALVAAVPFGFLAAGYRSAADLERDMDELGAHPCGVNLFVPTPDVADDLSDYAARIGANVADARWTDDDWDAKLEVVRRRTPAAVSFA